jgi:hypothetical protein
MGGGCRARGSAVYGDTDSELVAGGAGRPSSRAMSKSAAVELLEDRIDAAAANKVCWASCSTLVAAVSHFTELDADLEVLRSECSVGLTEDEVGALWSRVHIIPDFYTKIEYS